MHIHILGICGTFMGGVAVLAKAAGHRVSDSDQNVYPPMSTQLAELGIEIHDGYDADQYDPAPDCVVVGNAMSRGVDAVEAMLDRDLPVLLMPENKSARNKRYPFLSMEKVHNILEKYVGTGFVSAISFGRACASVGADCDIH